MADQVAGASRIVRLAYSDKVEAKKHYMVAQPLQAERGTGTKPNVVDLSSKKRVRAEEKTGSASLSALGSHVVALLRGVTTEQATQEKVREALKISQHELDQLLQDLCDRDVIHLDPHGDLHLLI